jgi:NDP-sugar pyrophosphorylase family protein
MNISKTGLPDLLVLCGGQGTRLRPVLSDRPKSLAMIGSRPFIDLVLEPFLRQGIRRVVLCTGHLGHQFEEWYADHPRPFDLIFSKEVAPQGTAGAIAQAVQWMMSDPIVVANGDSICEVDVDSLLNFHSKHRGCATVALAPADHRIDVGVVTMDVQSRISALDEKRQRRSDGACNAGIYVFNRSALALIPRFRPCSLETDWLSLLIPMGVYGFASGAPLYDIGTPDRLGQFQKGTLEGKEAAMGQNAC